MSYLVTAVAVIAMVPVLLFLAMSLGAWRVPPAPPPGGRSRRVFVAIPAHDEEAVIGGVLDDLARQDYPAERFEVHVVADRCTDATAQIAGRTATVHERSDGAGTKGAAVSWLLGRIAPAPDDLVVLLDADNRLGPGVVAALVDGADAGYRAMQARLEPSNPDASKVALAGAISQWMSNRLIDLARRNLGMSSNILGTGFAVTGDLTPALTTSGHGMSEDRDLNDRFAIDGVQIIWLHHLAVADEKPISIDVLTRQRARWFQGKRESRWSALAGLLTGPGSMSATRIERAVNLVLPGRIVSLGVLIAVGVVAAFEPTWLAIPSSVVWGIVLVAVAVSVAGLAAEHVGWRRIVQLPILGLFALIWIPERILARRTTAWYHTPHGGTGDG